MKPHGKVAAIMRTKDRPLLLRRAVESVLNQTDEDFVLSLINDGGDPKPVNELVESFAELAANRIVVTHHEKSMGMEAASNAAIRACDSKYCVIHDDDDAWHPDFVRETTSFLESQGSCSVKGVVTNTIQITEQIEGDKVTELKRGPWPSDRTDVTLWNICQQNAYPPIAFLYERLYDEVGYYDENLPVLGDWDFNIRFLKKYDVARLRLALAYYHLRPAGGASIYSNTITHFLDVHRQNRIMLINKHLREDIESGRMGVGTIMNIGVNIRMMDRLWDIENQIKIVDRRVMDQYAETGGDRFLTHLFLTPLRWLVRLVKLVPGVRALGRALMRPKPGGY